MIITTNELILSIIIAVLVGSFAAYLFWAKTKFERLEAENEKLGATENNGLQLAAYERLTLLTERMRLNNLATRLTQSGWSARDLQHALLASLREEFDHNITQQLYVKKEIWEAVTKMKDQNTFIVNQLATSLPADATSLDLSKQIVQFALDNPNATMNQLVLEALRYEAQQLM